MDAESFKKQIAIYLKPCGFKKKGATWWRPQIESIAVLGVQKSRWGGGEYYVNVGTYFRALGGEELPPSHKCHVQARVDVDEPSAVFRAALNWFERRALLQDAIELAESDSKNGMVFKELRNAGAT